MQDVFNSQYRDKVQGPFGTGAIEIDQRRWVCMRKKQMPKGSTAAMCGPYTRSEIINLLFSDQLTPKDYVWREGFTTWQTLETVAQLQPPVPIAPRITWNSKSLDWDNQEKIKTVVPGERTMVDHLLDAGIVLVCGLFALMVWRMTYHPKRAPSAPAPRAAAAAPRAAAAAPRAQAPRKPAPRSPVNAAAPARPPQYARPTTTPTRTSVPQLKSPRASGSQAVRK